jgi:hypothetical protein
MSISLEPAYLRYIYDGLEKGSIHPDNPADLPDGLIGLYDEAFDERISVVERERLLRRFAIWALLKKAVSTAFVAEVLREDEDEIQDFISTYSAWFNSPESGKYQLYHERLKVYLLQKLSERDIADLNLSIVDYLKQKVHQSKSNESVQYCYQHLGFHLYLIGFLCNNGALLEQYCLDDEFKKKQFEISGYFDWEETLLTFGIEYFAFLDDSICERIVFEKAKIQFKKKDVNLILALVRRGEMEIVFRFFENLRETDYILRVETAYFYFLSFFEIFEKLDWDFGQRKYFASTLLEVFQNNFQWDGGMTISQFVDVNITFRLHCYFLQYDLDFMSIAVLSEFDDCFDFSIDEPLKYIGSSHLEQVKIILTDRNKYSYGVKDVISNDFFQSDLATTEAINAEVEKIIQCYSKSRLIMEHLAYSSQLTVSFSELCTFIVFALSKKGISHNLTRKLLKSYREAISIGSEGMFRVNGSPEDSDGNSTLSISREDISQRGRGDLSLFELIEEGLDFEQFILFEQAIQYQLLLKNRMSTDEDPMVMLLYLDLSEFHQSQEPKDLLSLLSALIVEISLNINEERLIEYLDGLTEFIDENPEDSEKFESNDFIQLIDFFNISHLENSLSNCLSYIQEELIQAYMNFSHFHLSVIAGCKLINLFSKLKIEYNENQIVDRIIEDVNSLNEVKDYNEILYIEYSFITEIFDKPYFTKFYEAVKSVYMEQVRTKMSKYIFEDIIRVKGLSFSTLEFFKVNSQDFPNMYLWGRIELSEQLFKHFRYKPYSLICEYNDYLLEKFLLTIVTRGEFTTGESASILEYFGLNWVIELDQEFERLLNEK